MTMTNLKSQKLPLEINMEEYIIIKNYDSQKNKTLQYTPGWFKTKTARDRGPFEAKPAMVEYDQSDYKSLLKRRADNYYFEHISDGPKIKPFYDIDSYASSKEELPGLIEFLKSAWESKLAGLYPNGSIAVASSHGLKDDKHAVSFHFVVSGYETTISELRAFNIAHQLYSDKRMCCDNSVYRLKGGNMRLLFSKKPGSSRKKIPQNYKSVDEFQYHIIQSNNFTNFEKLSLPQFPKIAVSAPVSAPVSPVSTEEKSTPTVTVIEKCDKDKFIELLNKIKPRYEYADWLKIGYICYNNFQGSSQGFKIWDDYSSRDPEIDKYDSKKVLTQYNYFSTQTTTLNTLSYKTLMFWINEDYPIKNQFEFWYKNGKLVEEMNKFCAYYTADGTILYNHSSKALRTKREIAVGYFSKYSFKANPDDKKTTNPFSIWFESLTRRDVNTIEFDPSCLENAPDCYNTWKGYRLNNTGTFDSNNLTAVLHHVKDVLADNDAEVYEYILDWFAQVLQKPSQKTKTCLVLKSIEGTGKGIFIDMIGKIMGNDTYLFCTDMEKILGRFNKQAAGKLLVNFNETNWGGNIKSKGIFKSFITDDHVTIEEKGREPYVINNYANCCITSNNDWLVSVGRDDRRFVLIECKNEKLAKDKVSAIIKTDIQELANFFYNRDISNFDSTVYKKTNFHEDQVQLNWDSVQTFWYSVCSKELAEFDIFDTFMETGIEKCDLYTMYLESCKSSHTTKVNNVWFYKKMNKLCPSMKTIKATKNSVGRVKFPPIAMMLDEFEKAVY